MNTKYTAPSISILIGLSSLSASAQLDEIDVHGFISQGFMMSTQYNFQSLESKHGSQQFNEMGINFSSDISDDLRAGIQIFSRDYGTIGDNQIVVDWAYGDYSINEMVGIRAGRVKSPLGFYNETRDVDLVRTSILLPQSVYNETFRDFQSAINGAEIYGLLSLDDAGSLQYKLQAGYSETEEEHSGLKARVEADPGRTIDSIDSGDSYTAALIWLTPVGGLRLGCTAQEFGFIAKGTADIAPVPGIGFPGATQPAEFSADEIHVFTASAEYLIDNWVFNAEYLYAHTEIDASVELPAALGGGTSKTTLGFEQSGGYIGAFYRVNDLIELGTYYSLLKNLEDHLETQDLALSARFDLTENWLVKAEAHALKGGTEYAYPTSNGLNSFSDTENDDWYMFAVKTTFSF